MKLFADYFFCDGIQLHNWTVVCDFTIDCDDGTDEKGCGNDGSFFLGGGGRGVLY